MKKLIERIFPVDELIETVRRFPLSVICALSMFVVAILLVHDVIDEKEELIARVFAILGCCYLWFGISRLISESHSWSVVKYLIVSGFIAACVVALFGFSDLWTMHLIFVVPALLLGLMFAPYLTSGDDLSFWFFNRMMWFGVIVSYVALFMFAGGLSLALVAIHTLFEIEINQKVYTDIWLFASMVLGPLYALSWVPKTFKFTEEDCNDPPGLRFIVNWISAPMVFVYLLILYAYFIKIIFMYEVPNGLLAYMITGFAGAGIVTYLMAWPMRDRGSVQLRLFYRIFFPALLIPVAFHFYAIWERVSAYGITEQRYLILLSAGWFAVLVFGNLRSKMPIKAIPATLCVLLVFASFGPWGGVHLSGVNQFSRLEKLLVKHDLLQEGEIIAAQEDIPFEDRQNMSSIIDYLCQSGRDAMLEPWFNNDNDNVEKWSCHGGYDLTEQLGFDYISRYDNQLQQQERFYLNSPSEQYMDIRPYDFIIKKVSIYQHSESEGTLWTQKWTVDNGAQIKMEYEGGVLKVFDNQNKIVEVNVNEYVADKVKWERNDQTLLIKGENEHVVYQFFFYSIDGNVKGETPTVEGMNFDFLYRAKDQ